MVSSLLYYENLSAVGIMLRVFPDFQSQCELLHLIAFRKQAFVEGGQKEHEDTRLLDTYREYEDGQHKD